MTLRFVLRTFMAAVVLLTGSMAMQAVPAYPGLLTMTQPDGTRIQVRLYGDERGHYYTTGQGVPLLEVDGTFHIATLGQDGEIQAGDIYDGSPSTARMANATDGVVIDILRSKISKAEPRHPYVYKKVSATNNSRTAGNGMVEPGDRLPGLFPGSDFPTIGSPKVLVLLVEFSDVHFSTGSAAQIKTQLTQRHYTDRGFTGSALDYYADASMGQFTPDFDVKGPIRLTGNQAYYGGNTSSAGGSDARPREMVIEACVAINETVDFSQYDNNGDGYIDNVYIFYAGRGEASGGGANTIWPHSWAIPDEMTPVLDGVKLYSYACGNEMTTSGVDAIGTFCHEFGHVLGLPDLYSTSYACDNHPGAWALMASGSYVNNSKTPPTLSAWERSALGWLKPTYLRESGDYTLEASLLNTNQAYVIPTNKANEYFTLENRQNGNSDWDEYVASWGMLVWHIDYDEYIWNYNIVNDAAKHQYANIVEAHGDDLNPTRAIDTCFPGMGHTSFSETTTPALRAWDGTATDIYLTDISEDDDTCDVYFKATSRSGVQELHINNGHLIHINGLTLTVEGTSCEAVQVYSVDGRQVAHGITGASISVPTAGLYIVRCGTTCTKILF